MEQELKSKLKEAIRQVFYDKACELLAKLNDQNAQQLAGEFDTFNRVKRSWEPDLRSAVDKL